MNEETISLLAGIVRNATPLVIASLGETITERAGVVNLSLNGSIILAAMAGFVVALLTNSVWLGVLVAMLVGGLVALIIAVADIELRQDQVAVGFILTLLAADLAQFLGTDYTRVPGPRIGNTPIPFLVDIPVIGPIFFNHDWTVYLSYVLVFGIWFWMFRTGPGLISPGHRRASRGRLRPWNQCESPALLLHRVGWDAGRAGRRGLHAQAETGLGPPHRIWTGTAGLRWPS